MTPAWALLRPAYSVASTGKRLLSISAVPAIRNPRPTNGRTRGRPGIADPEGSAFCPPASSAEDDPRCSPKPDGARCACTYRATANNGSTERPKAVRNTSVEVAPVVVQGIA